MLENALTFQPKKAPAEDFSIKETLTLLSDERSRQFLSQHHKMLSYGAYVNNFSQINGSTNSYQHPEVNIESGERIISINPMLGRPLKQFVSMTGGSCLIHCFEENPLQYMQLCKHLIDWKIEKNVVPVCAAISSSTGMLAVDHQGGSGHYNTGSFVNISDDNRHEVMQAVYAHTIDQYVQQTGFLPTLIDCTRQGLATNILDGAKDTIKKHKPKLILADSPYSSVASLIKELSDDYQIYYSECGKRRAGVFFAKVSPSTSTLRED